MSAMLTRKRRFWARLQEHKSRPFFSGHAIDEFAIRHLRIAELADSECSNADSPARPVHVARTRATDCLGRAMNERAIVTNSLHKGECPRDRR